MPISYCSRRTATSCKQFIRFLAHLLYTTEHRNMVPCGRLSCGRDGPPPPRSPWSMQTRTWRPDRHRPGDRSPQGATVRRLAGAWTDQLGERTDPTQPPSIIYTDRDRRKRRRRQMRRSGFPRKTAMLLRLDLVVVSYISWVFFCVSWSTVLRYWWDSLVLCGWSDAHIISGIYRPTPFPNLGATIV